MIKKKLPGLSKKEELLARANNRMHKFMLADDQVRGAILHATHMTREMRLSHDLGILETLALGHAYMGVSLMTANLKGDDRIAFKIECSGPIKGLSVEATAHGEVRGYLKNNPIPIDKPIESFDLSPFFGAGFLVVTRFPEYARQPFVGRVDLKYGRIAADLSNYYLTSEQIPTAFNLSVKFDRDGNVTGAGGLFLQAMPNADPGIIAILEQNVYHLPSIGQAYADGQAPENFLDAHFSQFSARILSEQRVEFFCPCQKETISSVLAKMPVDDIKDMIDHGPFPIETRCHNCNTTYAFEKQDLETIYHKRFS